MDPKFEKFHKEIEFDRKVLKSILYFSRTEEKYIFPTIGKFILTELINAIVEYLTGREDDINYHGRYLDDFDFERIIEKMGIDVFTESDISINESIRDSILRLTELHSVSPTGPGHPYPDSRLYHIFQEITCGSVNSTFSFSEELIRKIENETLPSLSEEDKLDCRLIGQLIREYIEKDLEYIKEYYHW